MAEGLVASCGCGFQIELRETPAGLLLSDGEHVWRVDEPGPPRWRWRGIINKGGHPISLGRDGAPWVEIGSCPHASKKVTA